MKTDRETRTRIAAMAAAEAAIERNPRDPFAGLPKACAEIAARLGVEARAVHVIADGILVEALIETHLGPEPPGVEMNTLSAG